MAVMSKSEFKDLAVHRAEWCISIYFPVDPSGVDTRKDVLRLKNLISDVEKDLVTLGLKTPEVERILAPGRALLSDSDFWREEGVSAALFLAPDVHHWVRTHIPQRPWFQVSTRFQLLPLIPALRATPGFYVLSLSRNRVRLYREEGRELREIELTGLPVSLEEAMDYDDLEKQLAHHGGPRGGGAMVFHGQGMHAVDPKENLGRFFRKLDNGIKPILWRAPAPLVLAGVDVNRALFQQISSYPFILEEGVTGNPETMGPKELHEKARAAVDRRAWEDVANAKSRYEQLTGTAQVSENPEVIVPAAYTGQVDKLFVAAGEQIWGQFDPDSYRVFLEGPPQPEKDNLVDLAAVYVTLNGGDVHILPAEEMVAGARMAAVFHYPIEAPML